MSKLDELLPGAEITELEDEDLLYVLRPAAGEDPASDKVIKGQSVNKNLVGLENVDNTTDLDKPVSTATHAELDALEASLDLIDQSLDLALDDIDALDANKVEKSDKASDQQSEQLVGTEKWMSAVGVGLGIMSFLKMILPESFVNYAKTVLDEGAEVTNPRKMFAWFMEPNPIAGKMYAAWGGVKKVNVNGLQFIEKIIGTDGTVQAFSGADRPELVRTIEGFDQVCVEKESTNLLLQSNSLDTLPWSKTAELEIGVDGKIGKYNRWRINNIGDKGLSGTGYEAIEGTSYAFNAGDVITFSFFIEKGISPGFGLLLRADTTSLVNIAFDTNNGTFTGVLDNGSYSNLTAKATEIVEGIYLIEISFVAVNTENYIIPLRMGNCSAMSTSSSTADTITYVSSFQLEIGDYSTERIPTNGAPVTRLAPSPVIENALPETGTIGGVINSVNASADRTTFWRKGTSTDDTSWLILENNNNLRWGIYGNIINESLNISWIWNENERKTFAWSKTFDDTNVELWILCDSNIYKYSGTVGVAEKNGDVQIGYGNSSSNVHTSTRFEKPWYKDSIVRVNATDEEIKAFFEQLTRGTSMEMSAEDMVIV